MNEIVEVANPITSARIVGVDVDNEVYRKQEHTRGHPDYVMGRSDLFEFAQCPHKWLNGGESEDTEATEHGTLVDTLMLQPGSVHRKFAVCPETYTDEKTGQQKPWTFAANVCKAWREDHEGAIITKADKWLDGTQARDSLLSDPDVDTLLTDSKNQVMVVGEYVDKDTGRKVPLKGLIDIVPAIKNGGRFDKSLADLKTTRNASRTPWTKMVHKSGYHWQAALYLDLYTVATGEDRVEFLHLVQENVPPWEHAKRIVSTEFLNIGRAGYLSALRRYCQALTTGNWPGYDPADSMVDGWSLIQPEPWMIMQS